jgi:hypothetical protein
MHKPIILHDMEFSVKPLKTDLLRSCPECLQTDSGNSGLSVQPCIVVRKQARAVWVVAEATLTEPR